MRYYKVINLETVKVLFHRQINHPYVETCFMAQLVFQIIEEMAPGQMGIHMEKVDPFLTPYQI